MFGALNLILKAMDTNLENIDLTKQISAIIKQRRKHAIYDLKDSLIDMINTICEVYNDEMLLKPELYHFTKDLAGFTPEQLEIFLDKYDNEGVEAWIESGADGMLDDLIIRFVNFRKMNRGSMRLRFPCTFLKWSAQDDEDLRAIWMRTDQANPNWPDLEEMFGRPRNAIKIRLEKLGFTLPDPAVRRYS